ncbi:MAG: RNA-binding domain-containing protein [Candidatus Altiarchaeota archaeon]
MKAHHITVRAFSPKEASEALREILKGLLPADTKVDETVLEPEADGGVFKSEIVELTARLTRQKEVREFASKVLRGLDEYDKRLLRERLEDHVDDDCNMYLRLSKAEAKGGKMVLEHKDPIHVTFKLAAYPASRENALRSAAELLDEML